MLVVRRMNPGRVWGVWGHVLGTSLQIPKSEHLQLFLVGTSQVPSSHSDFIRTLVKMRKAIKKEVAAIVGDLLEWVKADILQRLVTCIQENGRQLLDLIFYTYSLFQTES